MAIEIQKKKKGGVSLLIILLVLVMGGWLLFNLIKKTEFIQPKIEEVLSPTSQEIITAQLDINKILNNPVFLSLTPHISLPLNLPQLGKTNPFLPF
ncbi:MAG: hypothetical protein ACPLXL_00655 [Minisyncoccia bacterium]